MGKTGEEERRKRSFSEVETKKEDGAVSRLALEINPENLEDRLTPKYCLYSTDFVIDIGRVCSQ